MKKLFYLILLLPFLANAQVNTVLQKTVSTGTIRSFSAGSAGTDTLANVYKLSAFTNGQILSWDATNKRFIAGGATDSTVFRTVANSLSLAQTQAALDLKAPLASPTFTGTPVVPGYLPLAGGALTGNISSANISGNNYLFNNNNSNTVGALAGNKPANIYSYGYNLSGSTSGMISVLGQANAGTYNFNLPVTVGSPGQVLTSQGGGSSAMYWTTLSDPDSAVYRTVANSLSLAQTQTALNLKANLASPTFTGTVSGIDKSMVGLSNAENTSDANKPVSTATQTALNLKANLASPTFTGTVSALDINGNNYLFNNNNSNTVGSLAGNKPANIYSYGFNVSGSTSGVVSILGQAAAGTYNFNLPTTAGTSGQVLTSAGGVGSPMTWTTPSGGLTGSGTANRLTMFTGTSSLGNSNWVQDGYMITPDNNSNQLVFSGNTTLIGTALVLPGGSGTNADAPSLRMGNTGKSVATMQAQSGGVGIGFLAYASDHAGSGNIKRYGTIGIDGNWYLGNDDGSTVTYGSHKLTVAGTGKFTGALTGDATIFGVGVGLNSSSAMYPHATVDGPEIRGFEGIVFKSGVTGATEMGRLMGAGNLTISGSTATKASGTAWVNPSDSRLKENLVPYDKGLSEILQMNPKVGNFNEASGFDSTKKHVWLIAQELQKIVPEMIVPYKGKLNGEETDLLSIDGSDYTMMLINAVKELSAKLEAAKARITALENK